MSSGSHRGSLVQRIYKLLKRFRFFYRTLFIRAVPSPQELLARQRVSINRDVSPPRLAVYSRFGAQPEKDQPQQGLDRRAVLIIQQGRFGNSFQQVTNAIRLASAMNISQIFLEPNEWLEPRISLSSGVSVRQLRRSEKMSRAVTQLFVGRFLWGEEFSFAKPVPPESEIGHSLGEHLRFTPDETLRDPNVLVVHLRGGDVYSDKPSKDYGQPPIGFYQRIFMDYEWERIHIVHEDNRPVVLDPLLSWCSSKALNVTHQSSDLRSDLEAILGASNLVVSNGSFGRAVCHLNSRLNRVFRMNNTFDLGKLDDRVIEMLVRDSNGQYVREVLSRNWRNSDAQRALMLGYSAENFEIRASGEDASSREP